MYTTCTQSRSKNVVCHTPIFSFGYMTESCLLTLIMSRAQRLLILNSTRSLTKSIKLQRFMVRVKISIETRRVCSTVRAANDIHVHYARILRLQTTVTLSIEDDLHLMVVLQLILVLKDCKSTINGQCRIVLFCQRRCVIRSD